MPAEKFRNKATANTGDEYQRLEYTPYGEIWVEKTANTGTEYLPYKFTGKEMDEETGLYYYGARYLDPKYSLWISTDPALGEYVPAAGKATASDSSGLPGLGGLFNPINSNLYVYSLNNPIKYFDPDGKDIHNISFAGVGAKIIAGADISFGVSWDDNGNVALSASLSAGIGVEASLDLPITPSYSVDKDKNINELPGVGAFKFDCDASATGLETSAGAVVGINVDNESNEITGFNTGMIGGSVTFASGTMYVVLKNGYKDLIKEIEKLDQKDQELIMHELESHDVFLKNDTSNEEDK